MVIRSAPLVQRVAFIAGQFSIDLEGLESFGYLGGIDEGDGAGDGVDEFGGHLVGVDDFGSAAGFGAEDLGDPILAELGLGHLVDGVEDDIALARGWGADEESDAQVGGPELALAEEELADLADGEVVGLGIGADDDGDVAVAGGAREGVERQDGENGESSANAKRRMGSPPKKSPLADYSKLGGGL